MDVRQVFPRAILRAAKRRSLAAAVAFAAVFAGYVLVAPIAAPDDRLHTPGTVVLGADGTVLQRDTSNGIRIPVSLDNVAPLMVAATLAAEDQRFYTHPGVDPIAVGRALLFLPRTRSGASTLTQQLARRLYIDGDEPWIVRKPHEAVLALRIEAHTSKDEILAAYLNDVPYGRHTYGIEAAARVYFGVAAANLDLAQAAFLAGLPRYPGLDVERDFAELKARQAYVLGRLRDDGKVGPAEAAEALAEPLVILPEVAPPLAPHFVQYALEELYRLRPDLAARPDLVIETTLGAGLQREAERVVAVRLADLKGRSVSNAAVVVLDPASGRVLAMVGSADPAAPGGQVNMALSPRQPGSALKPFLYAAALEHGYTAATPLLDVETTFETPEGAYTPGNYDRQFHGPAPLRVALASSLNVPAVRTLSELGGEAFLEIAHRFGLSTLGEAERYGLSLVLGGGEVRLLDLTAAYGTLVNDGQAVAPHAIQRVLDGRGKVLYEAPPPLARRIISAEIAWLLGDILRDRDARELGFGQDTPLEAAVKAAVKTGTTTGFRDNWTVGYTSRRVVGVWVGNTDNRAMDNISGVTGAGPIWRDLIEAVSAGEPDAWPAPPPGLVRIGVCSPTGLRPGADCPAVYQEWFLRGTEPSTTERYYTRSASGELVIDPPPEARAWAADAGLVLARDPASGGSPAVAIVRPVAGAVLYLSPELGRQEVLVRATGAGATRLEVRIDGELAGAAPSSDITVRWRLEPGLHRIDVVAVLTDGSRAIASSTYEVRP